MARLNSMIILLVSWLIVLRHYLVTGLPIVTTIQTKYGELYDCVDFYQQIGFDHPSLRDHKYKYQMKPSYDKQNDKSAIDPFDIWKNKRGCPENTIPIKRDTKQDLSGINIASELAFNNSAGENPGVQVAVLKTTGNNKYYGAGMTTIVYNPAVQSTQYSSSRLIIKNGVDSIAAGWTVNPSLYRDHETHRFIYTNTKNSHCYNTYCPGFIITRSDTPIDQILKPYTGTKAEWETSFYIGKDVKTGDWFLLVRKANIMIGYWPHKIFTSLADSANYIEWGGEVYSPPGTTPPPMGAGHLPNRNVTENCYARKVVLVNENHQLERNPPSCITYRTSNRYNLIDMGYVSPRVVERIIIFGGK